MLSAIFKSIKDLIKIFYAFIKWPLIGVAGLILFFCLCMIGQLVFLRFFKKIPVKHGERKIIPKESIIKRIFWELPKQQASDTISRDPDAFPYNGLILYCGVQGSGKTSALVHDTLKVQKEYPKCKVLSNLEYKYQDYELKNQKQLLEYKNGEYGLVVHLDEIANWFSSLQSKNMPPEILETISQQRKQRITIQGTAQVQERVAKPFREQTKEIRQCYTFFGCLTVVHRIYPVLVDGEIKEKKSKGQYFFVHDKELREAFDTYHVIESLCNSGFKDGVDDINQEPQKTEINYYNTDSKDKKKKK